MPQVIFKIKQQQFQLDDLKDEFIKQKAQKIISEITDQIQSVRCKAHDREPIIFLDSDGKDVRFSGFGLCCRDFAAVVNPLVKLPEGAQVMIKETSYLHSE